MLRKSVRIIVLLVLLALIGNPYTVIFLRQSWYDILHPNPTVIQNSEIDQILKRWKMVAFSDLPAAYIKATESDLPKYRKMLSSARYYQIPNTDLFQKIAGDFRIRDFVSRDWVYWKAVYGLEEEVFWLTDVRMLKKLVALQEILRQTGNRPDAFRIRYAHRDPRLNREVNGVGNSRHILGQAVDLVIGDVDGNGRYTGADKAIVLKILEEKVIRDAGGVGRYPGSRTVHFDTRGYRARWDAQ
ncbi:D-Ala-D-Ala carboxypeptidase family metallohydrolase [Flavilitoribacter nigricans]|uniref:Uncharacterized protein n=1 Tax=Flavilitoribacter nigricans (strain ATCC 23147 / DSM 23189 / NBRC 102662 / NCIMB 1420 / SS-2) TaxID=1122177 RepID=A0A2D0N401_FLAN2|nr:D-Ala-D-Ala carboxypeptidase family metallohydrolase [Flavilitoribacter nigricans]PHN03120.1 hypothetical protein CRP01_29000 [Flavilitoribacter nigricans DSM 23189 = NBRC 102662]